MMLGLYGRRVLYSDHEVITKENIAEVISGLFSDFQQNRHEIKTLYDIYTGKTDILNKKKEVRPEINHKVCENHAYEIVSFFSGYTFGEPVQYVHSGSCDTNDDALQELNRYMAMCSKDACDSSMADWLFICGVAYRLVLAGREDEPESPLRVISLDPRDTFVVRSTSLDRRIVMAGTCSFSSDGRYQTWTCYTKDAKFTVKSSAMDGVSVDFSTDLTVEENTLGVIPIVEYEANTARMGAFEPVVDLLNAVSELQSNRMDDVVQTVNSFVALIGCALDDKSYKELQEKKMLYLPDGTDAKYLTCPLDQNGIQTLKDDMIDAIITICGMPNRNGGSSTSDTGSAVILRDGWQSAEARAQTVEKRFKPSEYRFLSIALSILKVQTGFSGLETQEIEIKFTRRNYSNLLTKVQSLTTMLENNKIHPESAYVGSGLFTDPVAAYRKGMEWYERMEHRMDTN